MLNAKQVIFILLIVIFLTYFISGFVIFFLNGYGPIEIIDNYSIGFTLTAFLENYPQRYLSLGIAAAISLFIAIAFIALARPKQSLHGNARFASFGEIKNKMNLLGDQGLIIGKLNNKFLRFDAPEFISLGAPTRSGKGVSVVIPNLLEWDESAVVLDIKKECFDITSKYRKDILKQQVYLFNPFEEETHCYNPLSYISMYDTINRDNDLMDFANMLYPLIGSDTTVFFNQHAQNLFIGLCYLYHDLSSTQLGQEFLKENSLELEFSMYGILTLSQGFSLKSEEFGDDAADEISGFDTTIDYLIFLNLLSSDTIERLKSYLDIASANTKSGVESSFAAPLLIYRNKTIRNATIRSDFDFNDLRKKRITIYLGITPDKLAMARPILNIFFAQLIAINTKVLPQKDKSLNYKCLLLMDEFSAPGTINILQKSVSYMAGYGLKMLTIFQSTSQLENHPPEGYGKEGAKTLLQNHAIKIWYAPDDEDVAESLSRRLGYITFKSTSKSHSSSSGFGRASQGRNESDQKRALMLPQELLELPFDKQLITKANHKPILCNKVMYYKDPYFINKLKKVSKALRKGGNKPTKQDLENAIFDNELNIFIPSQRSTNG